MLKQYKIKEWLPESWPAQMWEIPQPPRRLYIRGAIPAKHKFLCIVGPRKHTEYAEKVCENLIAGLAGYPICIVSGLAFGIDSVAHQSALDHGLPTIAFPGSGLGESVIYPQSHMGLAENILKSGGALISEFENNFDIQNWMFPQRNRLMVAIADAVLVIEASEKSGTMITGRLTSDYNRELLVVPGPINSENARGSNKLIRLGATVVTCADDILEALSIDVETSKRKELQLSAEEKEIYDAVAEPSEIDSLIQKTGHDITHINRIISLLEIRDLIQFINGKICQK